jgi:hypothetical protein
MAKITDASARGAVFRRSLLAGGAAGWVLGAYRSSPARAETAALTLLSPKVQGTAAPRPKPAEGEFEASYTHAIADADARVKAERMPFEAQTRGLRSLEVHLHGRRAAQFSPGSDGRVKGWLDLSGEARGPLVVDVYAWSGPTPGGPEPLVKMRFILVVVDGRAATPAVERPAGHHAHGRALLFDDPFNDLSAGRVDNASAGKRWFTQKPGGGDFGDAAFERVEGPRNPYHLEAGFLRIRAQHDAAYEDPYGYKRRWYSGLLATAFYDGSSTFSTNRGYFETRMMVPRGVGVWPGFWVLPVRAIRDWNAPNIVELDIMEAYGVPWRYHATAHLWNGDPKREQTKIVTPTTATHYSAQNPERADLTWEFHEYGVDVTGSEYVFYCDGKVVSRMPVFETAPKDEQFFVLFQLAMGSGWPTPVPPGARHDLWVDYVRVYAPRA